MKKYVVTLLEEEREALGALTSKGKHRSQKILNALILLGCDAGEFQTERSTNEEIARVLKISMRKIDRVKRRFVVDGLEVCLNGTKGSRVYAKKADGDLEAHLVALSCSDPPEGFARWSLRLLADQVVELGYIDSVSHETVAVFQLHDGVRITPLTGDLLVRLGHRNDLEHTRQSPDPGVVDPAIIPHEADGGPLLPRHGACFVAQLLDLVYNGLHLGLRGTVFHHYQHGLIS